MASQVSYLSSRTVGALKEMPRLQRLTHRCWLTSRICRHRPARFTHLNLHEISHLRYVSLADVDQLNLPASTRYFACIGALTLPSAALRSGGLGALKDSEFRILGGSGPASRSTRPSDIVVFYVGWAAHAALKKTPSA